MATIRVLIVDDHALFRDGLRAILAAQGDMVLAGEAQDAESAIRLAVKLRPDIILMDLHLPGRSGVEATREIRASYPPARVIALTMYHDEHMVDAMIQAGAHGYVLKEARSAELLQAIRTVAAGGAALDPNVTSDMLAHYRQMTGGPLSAPYGALPGRAMEVLRLVAAGESNRSIAEALRLSEQTVKNLLSTIYRRLGVNNRAEAAAVALRRGLIKGDT